MFSCQDFFFLNFLFFLKNNRKGTRCTLIAPSQTNATNGRPGTVAPTFKLPRPLPSHGGVAEGRGGLRHPSAERNGQTPVSFN
jgi:hypothetical protein